MRALTAGEGLSRIAKLVRCEHWQFVVVELLLTTVQFCVDHSPLHTSTEYINTRRVAFIQNGYKMYTLILVTSTDKAINMKVKQKRDWFVFRYKLSIF